MKQTIIIGNDESIYEIAKQLLTSNEYRLAYILIARLDLKILEESKVVFLSDGVSDELKNEVLDLYNKSSFHLILIPGAFAVARSKRSIHYNDLYLFNIQKFKISLINRILKRIFDFLGSLSLIILLSPLMITIYIIIKLEDMGPALYRQRRLTYKRRTYTIYKFRTMIVNAENESGITLSHKDDSRITKVGRFLRKTRLDEIPQLFNVLIGDMSLVGPRPERRYYTDQFEAVDSMYKFRFNTLAGITGPAQINAHYNSLFKHKLTFDLAYIAHYSLLKDFIILIKTIKFIFIKKENLVCNDLSFQETLEKYGLKLVQENESTFRIEEI